MACPCFMSVVTVTSLDAAETLINLFQYLLFIQLPLVCLRARRIRSDESSQVMSNEPSNIHRNDMYALNSRQRQIASLSSC